MSEGGPSDDESLTVEETGKLVATLDDKLDSCLARLSQLEDEMYIRFRTPGSDEVDRAAIWARCEVKELTCIYDLKGVLTALAAEERSGRPWFEWLQWVLFGL
jgi:hypothetical protein